MGTVALIDSDSYKLLQKLFRKLAQPVGSGKKPHKAPIVLRNLQALSQVETKERIGLLEQALNQTITLAQVISCPIIINSYV